MDKLVIVYLWCDITGQWLISECNCSNASSSRPVSCLPCYCQVSYQSVCVLSTAVNADCDTSRIFVLAFLSTLVCHTDEKSLPENQHRKSRVSMWCRVFCASTNVRMVPQAVCFQAVVLQTVCGNFTRFITSARVGIKMNWLNFEVRGHR